MIDPIQHLAGIEAFTIQTSRLRTLVLTSGPESGEPVLFLHGNLSSSTFWEETMLALPQRYRADQWESHLAGIGNRNSRVAWVAIICSELAKITICTYPEYQYGYESERQQWTTTWP